MKVAVTVRPASRMVIGPLFAVAMAATSSFDGSAFTKTNPKH
jgi:hypothetical protein